MKHKGFILFVILLIITIISYIVYKILYPSHKEKYEEFYSTTKPVFDLTKIKSNPSPKKIFLFTIETRPLDLVSIHNKNLEEYAKNHGYKYVFLNSYKNKLILPVYWQKLQCMLDMMEKYPDYDYFVWLDSDSIISHPEIPLEYLIDLSPFSSIFIGKDHPSGPKEAYCAGVFMIKNDFTGIHFIKDCIDTYLNREKCISKNKYVLNGKWAGECYEQGIMNELLADKYKYNFFQIPESFLMNDGRPLFGSVILHLYGDKNYAYSVFKEYLECKPRFLPIKKNASPRKCCVLLTMYADSNEKKKFYEKILDLWLTNTKLDIYIVNSSGEILNKKDERLFQYAFKQKSEYNHDIGPSVYERDSIDGILSVFDFSQYDLIFKITGKYYIPDFEKVIEYIPDDADIVLQNQINTHGQNTEIIGLSPSIIKNIIAQIDIEKTFEQVAKSLYCSNYNIYRLPPLVPKIKVERSDGSILEYL